MMIVIAPTICLQDPPAGVPVDVPSALTPGHHRSALQCAPRLPGSALIQDTVATKETRVGTIPTDDASN